MFNNLVESDLHQQERVRRSWFFLGTLAAYAVLLLVAGVASIYAYDAHLDELTAEYEVTFVPPIQANAVEPERNSTPKATSGDNNARQIPERREAIARISESTNPPAEISSAPSKFRELPPGPVAITGRDIDVGTSGITGNPPGRNISSGDAPTSVHVDIPDAPPPPREVATPQPKKILKVTSVLNGRAISLPKPPYLSLAQSVKASGTVAVQVLIDETGRVVSAQAISGHPLLRAAAVQAARQARFSPTILGDQPVKVSGVITYNFVL